MFKYSHQSSTAWMGEFEKPQDALAAGRANYGADRIIYVGISEVAHFSDVFIGAHALLSYMTEDAVESHGTDFADPFQMLEPGDIGKLDSFLVEAIAEWESELAASKTFTGYIIKDVIAYKPDMQVRAGHFK